MSDEIENEAEFDETNPLGQIPNETKRANTALFDYYQLGGGRSLVSLLDRYKSEIKKGIKPPTRRLPTLADWSRFNAWQARVAAQEKLDRARLQARWDERQEAIREADYQQGERIRKLVEDALNQAPAFIKSRRRVVKGEGNDPDQIIVTMGIDAKLIVQAAKIASDLQRRAAGLSDEQTVNHKGEVATYPLTISEWRKRRDKRRAQVEKNMRDFDDETGEGGPNE